MPFSMASKTGLVGDQTKQFVRLAEYLCWMNIFNIDSIYFRNVFLHGSPLCMGYVYDAPGTIVLLES